MRETSIEKYLRKQILKMGGKAYKWTSPGEWGLPDRIIVLPEGRVYFVELKTETGELSKAQRFQLEHLQDLGCMTRVLYGKPGVEKFLAEVREIAI